MLYKSYMQFFTFYKNGEDGNDGTIVSPEPPQDVSKLWMDSSVEPPLLKYYSDEGVWTVVNKSEIDAIESRVTKAELEISNIDGTIESRCENVVETKVGDKIVDLEKKTSNITQTSEDWTATFEYTDETGKERSNSIRLSMEGVDVGEEDSYSRVAKDKFSIFIEGQEITTMNKVGIETDEIFARKRIRVGDVMMIATDYGVQERWVGD